MTEKQIEMKLIKETKKHGGLALKFISPGFVGMPDRILLLPGSKMAFVEVKAPGSKPRPLQRKRHETLRSLGFKVYVLDDERQIAAVISGGDAE
jgi:hypothetical protein